MVEGAGLAAVGQRFAWSTVASHDGFVAMAYWRGCSIAWSCLGIDSIALLIMLLPLRICLQASHFPLCSTGCPGSWMACRPTLFPSCTRRRRRRQHQSAAAVSWPLCSASRAAVHLCWHITAQPHMCRAAVVTLTSTAQQCAQAPSADMVASGILTTQLGRYHVWNDGGGRLACSTGARCSGQGSALSAAAAAL